MITEPFDEDVCEGRHGGNPESREAFRSTDPRRDMKRIVQWLTDHPEGATCDELEASLGISHQTCSARCSDLKRMRMVKPKPRGSRNYEKRPTRTGSLAAVLVLA